MERATQHDFQCLLDCVAEVYAHHDPESFGQRVLGLVHNVVPASYAVYNEFNVRRHRGAHFVDSPGVNLGSPVSTWDLLLREQPLIHHYQRTGDGTARKISDFLTRRRYHETALYREVFRAAGVEFQMAFYLPERPPNSVAIVLIRDRHDFTERERLILNLLRPHLVRAYRNAELLAKLREETAMVETALDAARRGVIVLSPVGAVVLCSPRAQQWLATYGLPLHGAGGLLPVQLRRWLHQFQLPSTRSASLPLEPQPFIVAREGRQLAIRLLPDSTPGQQMLLLEERLEPSPVPLQRLGLTPRQAEVLFWVAQGKTAPEIGLILGCRTATVNKHMERILGKLGVETRTAAATCAWQVMSSAGVDVGH
jgi:DNA-binding CsgD family transcriptional regulator